ncbi:MAG: sn-glycerol-1-phosphate dehydrogenase [Ruminococcaceae bacterium]|nr:sn-glycerol-1-phosphate dehydrogenase [Oscillospiraceae bacterium]
MNIQQLLASFPCTCGHEHRCAIERVEIGRGAIAALRELCREAKTVLVLSDENTFAAAGEQTLAALEGKEILRVTYGGDKLVVPNEQAVAAMEPHLPHVDAIVGIGAGVLQDLSKYGASLAHIPCHVVATAPSMDGYASTGAAMIMGGMKVTYSVPVPTSILADTAVLKDAPMELIRAGYGDIVGKFSALNDWKLSHAVKGEYFCQQVYDLMDEALQKTLALAEGLVARDEEAVGALMEALVLAGIAMSFAGSSRPASGSEHHLAHFFEVTGLQENKPYFPHGIDVAYATVVTAKLRQKLLSAPFPRKAAPFDRKDWDENMHRVYADAADGYMALQDKVGHYSTDRLTTYLEKEAEIRAILAEVPAPEKIEEMLRAVGYDMQAFYDLYDERKRRDAVLYAKDIKDRYTVLWMYWDLLR